MIVRENNNLSIPTLTYQVAPSKELYYSNTLSDNLQSEIRINNTKDYYDEVK